MSMMVSQSQLECSHFHYKCTRDRERKGEIQIRKKVVSSEAHRDARGGGKTKRTKRTARRREEECGKAQPGEITDKNTARQREGGQILFERKAK